MANCNFLIQFDNDQSVVKAGQPISGKITVKPDSEINCKSLDVSCCWGTHGRGNIASGVIDTTSLFQGAWQAGQTYQYPFKLQTATWPPTYYGTYLNVSHYVEVVAKIPWAKDCKARREVQLIGSVSPDDLTPQSKPANRAVVWVIGIIFGLIFLIPLFMLSFILVPLLVIGSLVYWFVFRYLPKRVTGDVQYQIEQTTVPLGSAIKGFIAFTPRRSSQIEGVTWTVICHEKCSSGSGSNRQTHTHEALKQVTQLLPEMLLNANEPKRLEFEYTVPPGAPLSMKLTDNEVAWSGELRIAIPGWPDWSKTIPLITKPALATSDAEPLAAELLSGDSLVDEAADPWLTEVFQQVQNAADDDDSLAAIIEAVADQSFELLVDTQGVIEAPYDANADDDADLEDDGNWLSAMDPRRKVGLSLHLPAGLQAETLQWKTRLMITALLVGLDQDSGRIMMNVQSVA